MASVILSDNGVTSGSAGLKTTAASDGALALQTTTAGGTATTALTIDTSQNVLVNTTTGYGKFTVQNNAGTGKVLLDNYATVPTTENVMSIYADATNGYIQSYNNGYKNIAICSGGGNALVGTTTQKNTTFGGGSSGITVANTGAPSVVVWDKTDTTYVTWLGQAGASGYLGNNANGPLVISTNGTERMRIDSSGNVGIGTSSPTKRLQVESGSTATGGQAWSHSSGTVYARIGVVSPGVTSNDTEFGTVSNNDLRFITVNTERMRIDTSGNLLVGCTTTGSSSNGIKLLPNGAGTSIPTISIIGNSFSNGNTIMQTYSTSASAYAFYIQWNGQIYAQVTSISSASDATLKTNVRPLETGLSQILALQPRRFDWIDGHAKDVMGFVAQEVQPILPELVTSSKHSIDENGNDVDKLHLAMGDMIPTMVKAIQELSAKNDALTARIVALEQA
jgi:hypothetical protein